MTEGFAPYKDSAVRDQQRASDPARSVWVNASAGTGKTKVLVDRVLRLLLPRADGALGTSPDRILCITYTKAAAAEMIGRLLRKSQRWSIAPDEKIAEDIGEMSGRAPTEDQIKAARGLFTRLVDGPEKVRIMTIHAFCQSVLARFPLEAGIQPHFDLIEDQKIEEFLHRARQSVFARARHDKDLSHHLDKVAHLISEEGLSQVIDDLLSERRQLSYALSCVPDKNYAAAIKKSLSLDEADTPAKFEADLENLPVSLIADLDALRAALGEGGTKEEQTIASHIAAFLSVPTPARPKAFSSLVHAFFTKNGTRRAEGRRAGVRKKLDHIADLYAQCGDEVAALGTRQKMLGLCEANESLLFVGGAIIDAYEGLKRRAHVLDFDDLIRYTHRLLLKAGQDAPTFLSWVMFKLDGGIDHILLDEAQDTNPEQWEIVKTLARDFAAQSQNTRGPRTLFIVGDQKQSIYRFQGADAEAFMRSLTRLGGDVETVDLNVSFRTAAPILKLVDHTFAVPDHFSALHLSAPPHHLPNRAGQAGSVMLWPLVPSAGKENDKEEVGGAGAAAGEEQGAEDDGRTESPSAWTLPLARDSAEEKSPLRLATEIARAVRDMIAGGHMLPARGRAAQPGDIMILTQKRRPMMLYLIAALQRHGVPVSGLDRLRVMEELAVEDLVAAAAFALCPHDDFSLACLIKSPLMGLDDDDLIALAPLRPGSLYQAVQAHTSYVRFVPFLSDLVARARIETPYQFLSGLLDRPCPAARCEEGVSGWQAMMGRMGHAARAPIEVFLDMALSATSEGQDLRAFIQSMRRDNPEMKRDSNAAENAVRIMTVHGSKGLESPIVILADAIPSARTPRGAGIFWPEKTGLPLPIWSPRAADRPEALKPIEQCEKDAEDHEYKRLLYVAMTRAEDELIITGADKGPACFEKSWYKMVADAFEGLQGQAGQTDPAEPRPATDQTKETKEGKSAKVLYPCDAKVVTPAKAGVHFYGPQLSLGLQRRRIQGIEPMISGPRAVQIISALQTAAPDRDQKSSAFVPPDEEGAVFPAFLSAPLALEQTPARPLRPERPSAYLAPQSPLAAVQDTARFRKGIYLHKLLQVLPALAPEDRADAATAFLGAITPALPVDDQARIQGDVLRILADPVFAPLFAPGSYAEVPLTGMTKDGRLVAGQIDRLCIRPDAVLVVDYKTNHAPPRAVDQVPPPYRAQMRAYRALLSAIYPDRPVRCALLWTETAHLMTLPDDF